MLRRIADSKKQRQIVATALLILAELEHTQECEESTSDESEEEEDEECDSDGESDEKKPSKRRR